MEKNDFISRFNAEYIYSRANTKAIMLSKLSGCKTRNAERLFLAEGLKLADEAISYAEPKYLIFSESFACGNECAQSFAERVVARGLRLILMSDSVFEKVSTEKSPQGIIAAVKYMDELHVSDGFAAWQEGKRILMLDEIRDPGNLGTIIRSAEAMGVDGVVLCGCADIYNPKTVRAAMGSLFRMSVFIAENGVECVGIMRSCGRRVLAAALGEHTLTLGSYDTLFDDCVIIGNEGHGISSNILMGCTACVKIPMSGKAESLNASSAAACIMWEYFRQK